MTKLLTLGILFSTAVRVVVAAKLVIFGILFLTSFILVLRAVVVAKLVILAISLSTSFILALREALVAKLVISVMLSSIFFDLIYISSILALHASFIRTSFFYQLIQQHAFLINSVVKKNYRSLSI